VNSSILDIDGNGSVTALSDGIIVVRYLFGGAFTGNALINGAVAPNATRDISAIQSYLESISGSQSSTSISLQSLSSFSSVAQQFIASNTVTSSNTSSKQIVNLTTASSSISAGNPTTISVNYSVDNQDNTLTGIGLRLHYDSTNLSYQGSSNLLQTSLFGDVTDNEDNQDFDKDPSTNRYLQFQYVDFDGNWPNQSLPVKLGDFAFNTSANLQKTKVNVTAVDVASGYTMEAGALDLVVSGENKNNVLSGTEGADTIDATGGKYTVMPGNGDDTIVVNSASSVIIELPNQGNDTIVSSVNYNLAALTQIENLTLTGTGDINGIGNRKDNVITGNSGQNVLTGLQGNDTFVFNFGDSQVGKPDRIADFQIGKDKIKINTLVGGVSTLTRASNTTSSSLGSLVDSVFLDANGAVGGNQTLGNNSAALVVSTTAGIGGTYLVVNDGVTGFNSSTDLVINMTGYSGTLPGLGIIPVTSLFV
jgi:hypothetical protein